MAVATYPISPSGFSISADTVRATALGPNIYPSISLPYSVSISPVYCLIYMLISLGATTRRSSPSSKSSSETSTTICGSLALLSAITSNVPLSVLYISCPASVRSAAPANPHIILALSPLRFSAMAAGSAAHIGSIGTIHNILQ